MPKKGLVLIGGKKPQLRKTALFVAGEQVVGARADAISAPFGGTTVDSEARTAIEQLLTTMRQHGLIGT